MRRWAPALADSEVAPLDGALAALNDAYGALEDSSIAITHAYLLEVDDRDALSEHGVALFGECDACVYIIAEQTIAGFEIYVYLLDMLSGGCGRFGTAQRKRFDHDERLRLAGRVRGHIDNRRNRSSAGGLASR